MRPLELTSRQRWFLGVCAGLVIFALASVALTRRGNQPAVVLDKDPVGEQVAGSPEPPASVTVHVTGGVQAPGVYTLSRGARVNDAVQAAGGMTPGTPDQTVNLAAPVHDGQQIYVPPGTPSTAPTPYPEPTPAPYSPSVLPGSPSGTAAAGDVGSATAEAPGDAGVVGSRTSPSPTLAGPVGYASSGTTPSRWSVPTQPRTGVQGGVRFPISINAASEEELQALPRIGPTLARRIVAYRNQFGPFQRIEDLQNVRGIGPKTMADIAPYVTL